jgi:hypothetical protein
MPTVIDGNTGVNKVQNGALTTANLPSQLSVNASAAAGSIAVDASGRVTMPYQPAFVGNPNTTINSTNLVNSYTNVRSRGGMTYSSGRITVPVDGEYGVLVNFITNGTNGLTYSTRKNGTILTYSAIDTGTFRTCALVQVVQMSASDYLEVWVDNGVMHSDPAYNTVSIFLLG